jgi:CheY-like chemotaxis protein
MKAIIDWLLYLERLAGDVYREAAKRFSEDKEFSAFLKSLAEDEDIHFKLIREVRERLDQKDEIPLSAVKIGPDTRDRVAAPLEDLYKQIKGSKRISKKGVMKVIARVEFAELNHIFQYIVNTFQKEEASIKNTAQTMQNHLNRIKRFMKRHSDVLDLSRVIQEMPTVGNEKLLIVDNKLPLRTFMSQALEIFGYPETASDGREALKKVRKHYFNLVISEINMPLLGGIEFFQKAVEITPDIAKRFIFYARDLTPDAEVICKAYNIKFLKVPFGVNRLHQTVRVVMDRG